MAEPNAQQLARQKLANTDLAKFAPPPPKRKKAEQDPPKATKTCGQLTGRLSNISGALSERTLNGLKYGVK